jgi:hypothetical protein
MSPFLSSVNSDCMRLAGRCTCPTLMFVLFALLGGHIIGVAADFVGAIHFPAQLDYGEGIVWQQAELIPGPRSYSRSQDMPFIVFHYPPLYHLLARAALPLQPDLRAAGRLVSVLASIVIAFAAAGIVLVATKIPNRPIERKALYSAVVTAMLILCLHAVRSWGMVMRVDMVAIALGLLGLLVGAWADGRFSGTTAALLLCVAAVFTKQTQLAPGVAIFVVALLRSPRSAIAAAVLAGGVGLAALELLQWSTSGGFLQNIISYNINRMNLRHGYEVLRNEHSIHFMALMMLAAALTLCGLVRRPVDAPWSKVIRASISGIRLGQGNTTGRSMLLLHFALASLILITVFKNGSSFNYLVDWLCVGSVLLGVLLHDLIGAGPGPERVLAFIITVLILNVRGLPFRQNAFADATMLHEQEVLVDRISAAEKPVASENMSLLMQAGKPILFEPAIVTELAMQGRWDETPLLDKIRSGGFAFMITIDNIEGGSPLRTGAVDAEMRKSYPVVELIHPDLWLHLPQR